MLDYFKNSKAQEISELAKLDSQGLLNNPVILKKPVFSEQLLKAYKKYGLAVIAEYKRASPSKGDINIGATPSETAKDYLAAGASAISVLTEETKFKGRLAYLAEIYQSISGSLPLLRKDFIFHPLQVMATAATRASAFLLIVKLTPDVTLLRELRELGEKSGLEAVIEIFDEPDLKLARAAGAKIIQVNSRNLNTLEIDREKPLCLAHEHKRNNQMKEIWIAASGMEKPDDLLKARAAGYEAVLIGTSLMAGTDPKQALQQLMAGIYKAD